MTPRRKRQRLNSYWEKLERDETDIEKGFLLCKKCKKDTVYIYVVKTEKEGREMPFKEKCSEGCYNEFY